MSATESNIKAYYAYREAPWTRFAREILNVNLDEAQEKILLSFQQHPRTVIKSGHARGKDYVAAVAACCFLLLRAPCKVILTAPTQRQVENIMMSECKGIAARSRVSFGGNWSNTRWAAPGRSDWFLLGFKAGDKDAEAWTGYHSPNIAIIITEASGISDETYNAIEGLLTGESRLMLCLNPTRTAGESYEAFRSPLYQKFTLSCLDAPNVVSGQRLIPGQVDREWIDGLLQKPGWATRIEPSEAVEDGDFVWNGQHYRAGDLFRMKVLGLWPKAGEDQLIPLHWIEQANARWLERQNKRPQPNAQTYIGADIAGMGNDATVFTVRIDNYVKEFQEIHHSDHMSTAGRILNLCQQTSGTAFVDTIGEGAGVFSRLQEQRCNALSVKFSNRCELRDVTGEREFVNMRDYCYWAIRDALDPQLGYELALPLNDELTLELTSTRWAINSQGKIKLEPKDDIKSRIGRSPDYADSLALTFAPMNVCFDRIVTPTEASMEVLAWA